MSIAPLRGPQGLYNVTAMPRFLLDSSAAGWQGAYFTDIHCAAEGQVEQGHERYCIQRGMHREMRRPLGSRAWQEFGAGLSVWRAGDEQRLVWRGSGRSQFLFLAPPLVEALLGSSQQLPQRGHHEPAHPGLLDHVFDALIADLAEGSPAGPLVGDSLIAALVAMLAHQPAGAAGRLAPAACGRAVDLIEARFADALTLQDLADAAGVSVRQFSRSFRQSTGCSPHQYLLQRRVEQARRLILQGLPLAEVAQQCGFADQSQLTRTFVRHTGTTPGRFRRGERH